MIELDIARGLAAYGIPVFVAHPDPAQPTGFRLPTGWQQTTPDPGVVDRWRPGMALCAVMGHGLDLVDIDPRSGGNLDALAGRVPTSYGLALTPSGGIHSFIRSIGVRSRDNVLPGVDIKAGDTNGQGRGFAFIAPTIRASKVTGEPVAYRWYTPPDLERLSGAGEDRSGLPLVELVTAVRSGRAAGGGPSVNDFMRSGPWANIEATLAEGRNKGVHRLAAALRGRGGWRVEDATAFMRAEVWPRIDQNQGGHAFTLDEFEKTIQHAWRQYPDGGEQRAEEGDQRIAEAAEGVSYVPPNPARYYSQTGALLSATLANDVVSLGPLAEGTDDRMWSYQGGVWRPAKTVVRDRVIFLLGEKYKRHAASTAEDIVRAQSPTITCEPISNVINFRNCLLDWRTGDQLDHTPQVGSTVQLPVDYDPAADCPEFEKFLAAVLPPDMIDAAWELIGYLMYSGNPLHKAVMFTGKGRNGKGTFIRTLIALLGRSNVTTVSLQDLVNTRFTTASLFGKLANLSGDIDGGYLESTATFKAITGGDMISAEHKGRDRFDFAPWCVPVFSANKIPQSADTTVGYLSRWLVVPFPNSFVGREDRFLDDKLTAAEELSGIAARGVAALPGLLERGDFELGASALAAREEFERRVDQVRTWLADCTDIHPDHPWIARTELYQAYSMWASRDGHRPVKAAEFYDRVEAAGGEPATIHGTRGFKRIKIIDRGGFYGQSGAWNGSGTPAPAAPPEAPARVQVAPERPQNGESQPEVDQKAAEPAPNLHPTDTPVDLGKRDSKIIKGAEGAETPHPPVRARTYMGGYEKPAPSAPKGQEDQKPTKLTKAELTKIKKAEDRAAAFVEAAGELVELPALVERASGKIVTVPVPTAVRLLKGTRGAWTLDVETTGYPIGHPDYALRTIQIGEPEYAIVFDAEDTAQTDAVRMLLGHRWRLHAHSATADLAPLDYAGLIDAEAVWERMHDTALPAKLHDPTTVGNDAGGLKDLAAFVLGDEAVAPAADKARAAVFKLGGWLTETKSDTPPERSGWAQIDKRCAAMVRYAASDVLDTALLAKRLPPIPEPLRHREHRTQVMTARVSHRGFPLDGAKVRELRAHHDTGRADKLDAIRGYGIDNPGSNPQVAAALTELGAALPRTPASQRFPDGQPSVKGDVLDVLVHRADEVGTLARLMREFRHHDKAISSFLEPYRRLIEGGDGRARPTIYTLGADTGRMSCVRPNLQQVPRQGGMRSCILADPGFLLISADFSGVETRVAAGLSQDPELMRVIAEHDADPDNVPDIHWLIARQVWGPDATKENRYHAKRGVFANFYGAGPDRIAATLGISYDEARRVIETMAAIAPWFAGWSERLVSDVRGGVSTFGSYSGRVIHMPRRDYYAAVNYAIQGTARELLVDALLRWETTPWGTCTVLPVHDELLAMVPADEATDALAALVECMTTSLYGVAIKAEASEPSAFWKDAS